VAAAGLVAAFAAWISHAATAAAPLFAQPAAVPSVTAASPSPRWTAAVDRARPMLRAAIMEQNLPGVSIAVGVDGSVVWAEGFGWRDVVTQTPVTPATRFAIGTATPAFPPAAVTALGLSDTGTDAPGEWSPGHIGEPEEDFPGFTLLHDLVLRPLGLSAAAEPLPGERATFYVPRFDDNDPRRGRRLMYMRHLACCAGGMVFYSTPSDLVRFALATRAGGVDGELAGGRVMSLTTRGDHGPVVVVASNVAHADTAALASRVADVFAEQK
jgi:CubicO group peptidase (beta-lactamase class C family)